MKPFSPHLWLKVERSTPSQIFIVALVGVPKLLRINLPYLISQDTIGKLICEHHAALREDGEGWKVVDCFGRVIGYYHHYEFGQCHEYDTSGKLIGYLGEIPPHYGEEATLMIDSKKVAARLSKLFILERDCSTAR